MACPIDDRLKPNISDQKAVIDFCAEMSMTHKVEGGNCWEIIR